MKDEYDFSVAQRGRFHREDACLVPPVHPLPKKDVDPADAAE
jgi:hypothetical protein